jgi:hypothetical protein
MRRANLQVPATAIRITDMINLGSWGINDSKMETELLFRIQKMRLDAVYTQLRTKRASFSPHKTAMKTGLLKDTLQWHHVNNFRDS